MRKVRPLRIDGDTAYVTLSQGLEAIIDSSDADLVGQFNWSAEIREKTVYAVRFSYRRGEKREKVYLHRLLLNPASGLEVDHRDLDGLNNRRSNLRSTTHQQNLCNREKLRNNTSGIKGVRWNKKLKKWTAEIRVDQKTKYLGLFDSRETAIQVRNEATDKHHGEFGRMS